MDGATKNKLDQIQRLQELERYGILDTPPETGFDALVASIATICETPVALISLIDHDRQWFKAVHGLDGLQEAPHEHAFCSHTIRQAALLQIEDARRDPRFRDNPMVTGDPYIRFFAGVPLMTNSGHALGSLCVIDYKPKRLDALQRRALESLAVSVMALLEDRCRWHIPTERLRVTLESIGDAVLTTDVSGCLDYLNPAAETLTGWSLADAAGRPVGEVFTVTDERDSFQVPEPIGTALREGRVADQISQTILRDRQGQKHAIESSAAPIRDAGGHVIGAVSVFRDITEQRRLRQQVEHQARHDVLTGLVNRYEIEARLGKAIEGARTQNAAHALAHLDLDRFKVVNDSCGHAAGDALLKQLSGLLVKKVRQRDTLARLGGDEFGLLLEHCPLEHAQRVVDALRDTIEDFRFRWQEHTFRVGVSVGLVPIGATSDSAGAVLQAADSACYVAKESGRGRVHVYREHDEDLARRHGEMGWVPRIQRALEEGLFMLYVQPILPLSRRAGAGAHAEVLLRLVEDGELIAPGAFMPAAERYDMTAPIDCWVVRHALQMLAERPACLARLGLLSINLSGRSIGDCRVHAEILRELDRCGVAPEKICFEVTETAAVANLAEATRFMRSLRERGCHFALDDFGSGLSSFAYLKTLPVNYLKIDGVFVKDIHDDPLDLAMVRAINEIGQLLGKKTVAEFIENERIAGMLRDMGVDYGQGYGLGRPQPMDGWLNQLLGGDEASRQDLQKQVPWA